MVFGIQTNLLRQQHPLLSLSLIFVAWKTVLLCIAFASPGPGYDTSTTLLDFSHSTSLSGVDPHERLVLWKLVRWDAIYYIHVAQRGHLFEQEWAFGTGLSKSLSLISPILFQTDFSTLSQIVTTGVVLAHLAHFAAVVLIWDIASDLDDRRKQRHSSTAYITALLHIFSPAGIFLSAPCAESLFASLSFLGLSLYIKALLLHEKRSFVAATRTVIAGAILGQATVARSNGILAGLLYAGDAVVSCVKLLQESFTRTQLLRLTSIICGGLLVGFGLFMPQFEAYTQYCTALPLQETREWCRRSLPSIFTFVQAHYWNVGLFRYWTLSNIPLFLLATPTLTLMICSAAQCIPFIRKQVLRQRQPLYLVELNQSLAWRLAVPQIILAILALTSYHVQIITRIASGYPLWYIWLAAIICHGRQTGASKGIFRWMVLYALIQAGLYACFLPPA